MVDATNLRAALKPIAWAEPHPTDRLAVLVDPDKAYPAILKELGVEKDQVTQYWLEVAYQFCKLDLQAALRRSNFRIHIRSDDGRKDRWRLAAFPPGKGAALASQGREARGHYLRLRGYIPNFPAAV